MEYSANVMLDPVGLLLLPQYSQDIPSKLLRRMLLSGIWQKYQRGHISLEAAACLLAKLPFVSQRWAAHQIVGVLQNRTLKPVNWMLQLLDVLREQLHLRLFCVCNASPEEMMSLQDQFPSLFAKFDATFSSGEEGFARPSMRFLNIALNKAHVQAHDTFYLDSHDSLESIIAAQSLGMHAFLLQPAQMDKLTTVSSSIMLMKDASIRFSSTPTDRVQFLLRCSWLKAVRNASVMLCTGVCNSEVSKIKEVVPTISYGIALDHRSRALALAWKYLLGTGENDSKKPFLHPTLTSDGLQMLDNFTHFLIADVLDDHRFLPMQLPPVHGLIQFTDSISYVHNNDPGKAANTKLNGIYYASEVSAVEVSPDDLDSTSIGLSVLHKFGKVGLDTINRALDIMLDYRSEDDNILQVYFDAERPRMDPVVVANAVYLFHLANRGHEVERSESFVESVLLHRAYEGGTLYYHLPETFLWCVARLVHKFKEHFDKRRPEMRKLLASRLQEVAEGINMQERENTNGVLALAMHMRACSLCGIDNDNDAHKREELVRLQRGNGSWHCNPFYRYGYSAQSSFTNEGLSTAFVVAVLAK